MSIGIAFTNLAAPNWSLERALEAVHEYGYQGLELRLIDGHPLDLSTITPETRRRVAGVLAGADLPIVCLDSSIKLTQFDDQELILAVELAAEWGTSLVRVFGGPLDPARERADTLRAIAAQLQPGLEHAAELGITVAVETHDDFSSATIPAELLRYTSHPSLRALWDFHHPYRMGESPEEVLALLGDNIAFVHVKDARRNGEGWDLTLLGEGEVPVAEGIAALRRSGYAGWISVEWEKYWLPDLAEPEVALPQYGALLHSMLNGGA